MSRVQPLHPAGPALHDASDETLARALIANQLSAPRVAWQRFSPMVRRILRRSLGPGSDTEDLVQEVFLCLFTKVKNLREPKVLKAFIISITTLTVRQELRRRKMRRWVGLGKDASVADLRVVHPDPDAREALDRFYAILDRFSSRDRTAFVLRFIEGLELTEVASAIGVSLATTKRCLSRTWRRMLLHVDRDPVLGEYLKAEVERSQKGASRGQRP